MANPSGADESQDGASSSAHPPRRSLDLPSGSMAATAPDARISSSSDDEVSDLEVSHLLSHAAFERKRADSVIRASVMQRAIHISAAENTIQAAEEALLQMQL